MISYFVASVLITSPNIAQTSTQPTAEQICQQKGDGYVWDVEKQQCLKVSGSSDPSVPQIDDGGGTFCQQFPNDPFCGGSIPTPKVP